MPTAVGRQVQADEAHYKSLGDAITDSYATDATGPRWQNPLRDFRPLRPLLAIALFVIVIVGAALGLERFHRPGSVAVHPVVARTTDVETADVDPTDVPTGPHSLDAQERLAQQSLAQQSLQRPIAPITKPTPRPTEAPTPAPSPTSAPTSSPTASPTAEASAIADSPEHIHNAPLLVQTNSVMKVGKRGSCSGQDVSVDVSGYPRGCTLFDNVSSGRLKNGRGTVLIVPVSTTEDVSGVAYGLLYLQPSDDATPQFLGLLRGTGSGPVSLTVQDGFIVEKDATQTRYATFNGHGVVWIGTPG